MIGFVLQTKNKYRSFLVNQKHPDLLSLYKFAFQRDYKPRDVSIFRSLAIYNSSIVPGSEANTHVTRVKNTSVATLLY
jgi:hypothetical protein